MPAHEWQKPWNLAGLAAFAAPAFAQSADDAAVQMRRTWSMPTRSHGDTAWMLTVHRIRIAHDVAGLALFYGGMVRKKNTAVHHGAELAIACLMTGLGS